jgi:hypothetical protein
LAANNFSTNIPYSSTIIPEVGDTPDQAALYHNLDPQLELCF